MRTGPPAAAGDIDAAAAALPAPLPEGYRAFLLSFDGADLFHETVMVAGVGAAAVVRIAELDRRLRAQGALAAAEIAFATAPGGDAFVFDAGGGVIRVQAGSDERWLSGSSFARWLDAMVAHEEPLYGSDGEFLASAFDPDGEEVAPRTSLRQAERACKRDPGSAEWHHERGVALRRLGRRREAASAFRTAAERDPGNPWPSFDLGRLLLDDGDAAGAAEAFRAAAACEAGPGGARLWAWAARSAVAACDSRAATAASRRALACDPDLDAALEQAAAAASASGDSAAAAEADALRRAVFPDAPRRKRLPIA